MADISHTTLPPIRDAATLILLRDRDTQPRVLMGKRGAHAAFMPGKFVFPGGAVDADEAQITLAEPMPAPCRERLAASDQAGNGDRFVAAAIRELWEEAGLILGCPGTWAKAPPPGWESYAAAGYCPSGAGMSYIFRAITPPGRPRRFDARFLLANIQSLASDPGDFSAATDELSSLQWVTLSKVDELDLPPVTRVVLMTLSELLQYPGPPVRVPFLDGSVAGADIEARLLRGERPWERNSNGKAPSRRKSSWPSR